MKRMYYPLTVLSSIHYRLGNLPEAIDAQAEAMAMDDTLALLGEQMYFMELALQGEQLERAERHARAYAERIARRRDPDDPLLVFAQLLFVDVHRYRGELETAEELARAVVRGAAGRLPEKHPFFSLTHLALAETLVAAERPEEARSELQWVIDADANGHHVRAAQALLAKLDAY